MHTDEIKIWGSSLLITSFVFSLLLVNWQTQWQVTYPDSNHPAHKTERIIFSFSSPEPAPLPVMVPETISEPESEAEQQKQQLKPLRKTPIQPVIAKVSTAKPQKPTKRVKPQPLKQKQEKLTTQTPVKPFSSQAVLPVITAEQTEKYFQQLLKHIEKYKFYPLSARRRGIQGNVRVSFMLHKDGQMTELSVIAQHSVLKRLSTQAIQSALPLPIPPDDLQLPRQIQFNLRYVMR